MQEEGREEGEKGKKKHIVGERRERKMGTFEKGES